MDTKDETGMKAEICCDLGLNQILARNLEHSYAGVFQRFSIGLSVVQSAEVHIFDQPSNYIDVKRGLRLLKSFSLSRPYWSLYFYYAILMYIACVWPCILH